MSWEERELVSLHDALGGERGHLTYTNHCHAANSHRFGKSRALGFLRSGPSWKLLVPGVGLAGGGLGGDPLGSPWRLVLE